MRCGDAKSPYQWTAVPWGEELPKAEERGISKPGSSIWECRVYGGSSMDCRRWDGGGSPITSPVNMNPSEWSEPRSMFPSHFESPERPFSHPWEKKSQNTPRLTQKFIILKMDIMLREICQSQRDKYCTLPLCEAGNSETHKGEESSGGCQGLGEEEMRGC